MDILLDLLKTYGAGVGIVIWVLVMNAKREERYISIIEKFSKSFEVMRKDISDIKNKIFFSGHNHKDEKDDDCDE